MSYLSGDVTLGELIQRLEREHPDKLLRVGLTLPHSYRGDYADLAFELGSAMTVADVLEGARSCVGATFEGYKGGKYDMTAETPVWIAKYGDLGEQLGSILLNYLLADEVTPAEQPVVRNRRKRDATENLLDDLANAVSLLLARAPDLAGDHAVTSLSESHRQWEASLE